MSGICGEFASSRLPRFFSFDREGGPVRSCCHFDNRMIRLAASSAPRAAESAKLSRNAEILGLKKLAFFSAT